MMNAKQLFEERKRRFLPEMPPPENEMPTGEMGIPNNAREWSQQSGTSPPACGATSAEWQAFTRLAREDILPVVSDPTIEISSNSKMSAVGKVPSVVNGRGNAVGFLEWPSHHTTQDDIAKWRKDSRLGICLITRRIRALDVDINDAKTAGYVYDEIAKFGFKMPKRSRSNSSKFLLLFELPGDYAKRVIRCDDGLIEFLGSGQQCVVAGSHPSGVRVEWKGGLPQDVPTLTPEQFEALWKKLHQCFAGDIDEAVDAAPAADVPRVTVLNDAVTNDPTAQALIEKGATVGRDGKLRLPCPFADGHTPGGDDSLVYFPRATGGYTNGNFKCLHASCEGRTRGDFLSTLDIETAPAASADDFDVQPDTANNAGENEYVFETYAKFSKRKPPSWIVHSVIPAAALAVIFGESGSGKTFLAVDLALAVARGTPWRGHKVRAGAVAYVAAEDANGVAARFEAYKRKNDLTDIPAFGLLAASPNFLRGEDVNKVLAGLRNFGPVLVVFVDTLSAVTPGANENSGEDMGKALGYCKKMHEATGALIVLIHHSGKDPSKGARGWSGLRAAADCEIEVTRVNDDREAQVTKQKGGVDGERFGFKLVPMVIGADDDGEVISSCVVEHGTVTPRGRKGGQEPKGAVEKLLMRAVNDLSIAGPVAQNDVIEATVNRIASDPGKRDRRRERALRALNSLVEQEVLILDNCMVSVAGAE